MDRHEPCGHKIDQVMKHVCICDAVDCCINGDTEQKYARKIADAGGNPWNHLSTGQSLHEKNEGHD